MLPVGMVRTMPSICLGPLFSCHPRDHTTTPDMPFPRRDMHHPTTPETNLQQLSSAGHQQSTGCVCVYECVSGVSQRAGDGVGGGVDWECRSCRTLLAPC